MMTDDMTIGETKEIEEINDILMKSVVLLQVLHSETEFLLVLEQSASPNPATLTP